jgi:hypothetical protein
VRLRHATAPRPEKAKKQLLLVYVNDRRLKMTAYVRRFDLRDSLSDSEVKAFWTFMTQEFVPACDKVSGLRSVKLYSGQGALRADLRILLDMDNASVYENLLHDPGLRTMIARFYAALDLRHSTQTFLLEITPELIRAIGS